MKDETKEILDKLLEYFKESNINDFGYEKDKLISYEEAQILLDYITNLQEENERLRKNQKLTPEQRNHLHLELDEICDIYKSRIDKAVKLLNNDDIIVKLQEFENKYTVNFYDKKKELLNILEGSDKK